jgi:hypothetical protein
MSGTKRNSNLARLPARSSSVFEDSVLISAAAAWLALRELAHLARHHREALAVLPGARRFHRRIQRQKVGLAGDLPARC